MADNEISYNSRSGSVSPPPSKSLGRGVTSARFFSTSFTGGLSFKKYSDAIEIERDLRQEDDDINIFEEIRIELKKYLAHSRLGFVYENLIMFISVLSSLHYMYQTYLTEENTKYQYSASQIAELDFAIIFSADWAFNLFLADHRIQYVLR